MKLAKSSLIASLRGYRVYGTALIESWDGTIEMKDSYMDYPDEFDKKINDNGFGAMRILAAHVIIEACYGSGTTFASGELHVLHDSFYWDPINKVHLDENSKYVMMLNNLRAQEV